MIPEAFYIRSKKISESEKQGTKQANLKEEQMKGNMANAFSSNIPEAVKKKT
ncbi:MAG: hypothetical protein KAJ18_07675 [Candidatus Omnitrophica bacterium]|nr:hypothetical protein [Candidatus Omnitrophota bacterium]